MDPAGKERTRMEGYLPRDHFNARLKLGLARTAFMSKKWPDAEGWYQAVIDEHAGTAAAAEAIYWRSVCHYKASGDHSMLPDAARELAEQYPNSDWAAAASAWLG